MQTTELAVVCSGMPGFIRSIGSVLIGHFRQLECYSVSEAAQMTQMHEPAYLVIDLRNALRTQCDRMWAILHNSPRCRSIAVVQPGTLAESAIPREVASRVCVVEQVADEDDLHALALRVLDALRSDPPITKPSAHPPMLERLQVAAQHDVTILLIGETGSGKTHLARLIHEESRRTAEPFVTVACGAIAGELIESELFGHTKGAFTSAHADKDGKFLAAGRGTILLDEIDVLTPEQQVKLLRIIETGQFEPVGSNGFVQTSTTDSTR